MTNSALPDCMMPDGAAPCEGYLDLQKETLEAQEETLFLSKLLIRYIDHVGQCYGDVFLREILPDKDGRCPENNSRIEFTDEELEILRDYAQQGWYKDKVKHEANEAKEGTGLDPG